MIVDLILDSLRNAVLIAGLVVVMMMLIETLNINQCQRLGTMIPRKS